MVFWKFYNRIFKTFQRRSSPLILQVQENGPIWVFVIGWTASQPQHLRAFQKLYHSLNISTISRQSDYFALWDPTSKLNKKVAEAFVKELETQNCKECYVHVLSNGGLVVYKELIGLFTEKKISCRGLIIDSAPSKFLSPVYAPEVLKLAQLSYQKNLLYAIPANILWLISRFYNFLDFHNKDLRDPIKNPLLPTLYFFSDADTLITAPEISDFITHRSNLGCETTAIRFSDSPHIQHYRYYPEEYKKNVHEFIFKNTK